MPPKPLQGVFTSLPVTASGSVDRTAKSGQKNFSRMFDFKFRLPLLCLVQSLHEVFVIVVFPKVLRSALLQSALKSC